MSHRYCFTKWDSVPIYDEKEMDYIVFQLEKAPTTNKLHWQGYVEFKKKCSMAHVKSVFKDWTMHIEVARGTAAQNIAYCTKPDCAVEELWHEGGVPRAPQGTRTDLINDKKILDETKDITQVSFANFCRYNKAFEKYIMMKLPKRNWEMKVDVYWGETDMKKSKTAFEMAGTDAYWKDHTKWWDGYKGEEIVVMDDFHPKYWDEHYLRNLWDRYPFRIEFKGGSCQFSSKRIVVTTNEDPNNWSPELKRRINIHKMT